MPPLQYPTGQFDPAPLVDLNSKAQRERLSSGAVRAFFNIMERWQARDEDARALLGGMSNGPYYKLKRTRQKLLDADVLARISYLVGIYKALHILYGETLADQWVHLPNSNRLFAGRAPISYMAQGGIPAIQLVRRLLDARRGGV
jgi:hypothetical protein